MSPLNLNPTTKSAPNDTSWENVKSWYNNAVGDKGHYFHQNIVLPSTLRLLNLKAGDELLDLACGQGVLERTIPTGIEYLGIDKSKSLIEEAEKIKKTAVQAQATHTFLVQDVAQPLNPTKTFTHATIILALQNMENIETPISNISKHLQQNGKALFVINHPYFRIPRHSMWETDEKNNTIYRKANRYMSTLKVPIAANPGQKENSAFTTSYHYPLAQISKELEKNGLKIQVIEEWISDKDSVGKHAKAENIARKEFPLFMAILAVKI